MSSMDAGPALKILKQVAAEEGLPTPLREIGSGSEGIVFDTTDPNMVCRVGTRERVFELMEWQHTNAVVKVHYIEKMEAEDEDGGKTRVVVSWQEMVDDNVEGFFYRKYKEHKEIQDKILGALSGLYDNHWGGGRNKLKTLKDFEETEFLAEAIEEGLPTNDLSLESNLGVTLDGRVVAFDL
jgi:hypothetical protein